MFKVQDTIYVDIANLKYARARTKQYDNGMRYITIVLNNNGKPLDIVDNTVKVYLGKPDGTYVLNDVKYVDIHNGVVEIEITSQMSVLEGIMPCELVIWDNNSKAMTTSYKFEIQVDKTYFNQAKVTSTNEFGVLGNLSKMEDFEVNSDEWTRREDGLYETTINHEKNVSLCFIKGIGKADKEERVLAYEIIDTMSIKVLSDEAEDLIIAVEYKFC